MAVHAVSIRAGDAGLRGAVERGISAVFKTASFRGRSVMIKPNFCGPGSAPHLYSMTDINLVRTLSDLALDAGASRVFAADTCAGYVEDRTALYRALGVDGLNVPFYDLCDEGYTGYHGYGMSTALENCDVIINSTLPKTHHQAGMTLPVKNLVMGLMEPENRRKLHEDGNLAISIASINKHLRTDKEVLDVLDARYAQEGLGPHFGDPVEPGFMLFGAEPGGVDYWGSRLLGFDPQKISYLAKHNLFHRAPQLNGDRIETFSLKPSPHWEFADIGLGNLFLYWPIDNKEGRTRIYALDRDDQIYRQIGGELSIAFPHLYSEEEACEWVFTDGIRQDLRARGLM